MAYEPFSGRYSAQTPEQVERDPQKRRARLHQILGLWQQYPGRAPQGTGLTGLMSTDSRGWSQMLREQIEAKNLSRDPDNPVTVGEAPYEEDSRAARRRELAQMDARRALQAYRPNTG